MSTTKLKLPQPIGINVLERDATTIYLRWTILSSHGLSKKQLKHLQFEFRTTDNKLRADCIDNAPSHEYKARLCGLSENTKYRFQLRSKLKLNSAKIITSSWSDSITVSTHRKRDNFVVISDEKQLERESIIHRLKRAKNENIKLHLHLEQLQLKLENQSSKQIIPSHWDWDCKKIANWIMRIEGGLLKPYSKSISNALEHENITGKDLVMVCESDIKDWGVTNFNARKILIQYIETLTINDIKPTIIYDATLTEQLSETLSPHNDHTPIFIKQHGTQITTQTGMNNDIKEKDKNSEINNEIKEPELPIRTADISQSVQALLNVDSTKKKVWSYKEGMLSVLVIGAINVDNMDVSWDNWNKQSQVASDPYVELVLTGNYKNEKTNFIENCANPIWNEKFQLFVDNAKKDVLKCYLYDHDKWTMDDKIGQVEIPVINVLDANGYMKKEFDVIGSKTGCKLELEIKYWESMR
eukprot:113625_1